MKRKIKFDVTIGSVDGYIDDLGFAHLPSGGDSVFIDLEFEWDKEESVMLRAEQALKVYMDLYHPHETYHIWYWWWLDHEKIR